jgi:hypothetical protein
MVPVRSLLLCTLLASPRVAWGQPATQDARAQAEEHFRTGKRLMQEGHMAEACRELAASQSLDPAAGTLLNLAECHENEGRYASAYREFSRSLEIAKSKGREDRVAFASEHLRSLAPKLSTLTIHVPAGLEASRAGLALDDVPVEPATWGTPMPIDPGPHVVRATLAGKAFFEKVVAIGATADAQSVDVPAPPEALPATEPPRPARATPAPTAAPAVAERASSGRASSGAGDTQRILSYAVAGVGVAALAVGTVFVVRTDSLESQADQLARGGDPSALSKASEARTAQTVARIGFGVGIVALGTGAVLFFSAPRAQTPKGAGARGLDLALSPEIGPTEASLALGGAW